MLDCDACMLDKGIERPATHDAPVGGGLWANLCAYCVYRLPAALKALATPTEAS